MHGLNPYRVTTSGTDVNALAGNHLLEIIQLHYLHITMLCIIIQDYLK